MNPFHLPFGRLMTVALLSAVLAGGSLAPWFPSDRASGQGWKPIQAQDNTFVGQIPSDWTATSTVFQNFTASNPRTGEAVTVGSDDVLADEQSLRNAMNVCQQSGLYCQFRYWSPRLTPYGIVLVLFPRYNSSMQSVRILGVWPLNVAGFPGALVRYKYTVQGAPMEGFSEVFSLPGVALSQIGLTYWNFVAANAAGPRQIFRRNLPLYANILQSLRYNPKALQKIGQAPLRLGEDLREIDRQFGRQWWPTLGGDVPYATSDGRKGTVPRDELPPNRDSWDFYICPPFGFVVHVPKNTISSPCPDGQKVSINY